MQRTQCTPTHEGLLNDTKSAAKGAMVWKIAAKGAMVWKIARGQQEEPWFGRSQCGEQAKQTN
jgi:hypothetical protein